MPRSGVSVPQRERARHDEEPPSESYRVEVERYWRQTASRRSQIEARQVRRARRFSGEGAGAGEHEHRADDPRTDARAAVTEGRAAVTEGRGAVAEGRTADAAGTSDPYRELLHSWAREAAREPARPTASGRRTVSITGYGAEAYVSRNGTRPSSAERHRHPPRHERAGFEPDRVAMWAVLLGLMMVLAAAASAHAAAATVSAHAAAIAHAALLAH